MILKCYSESIKKDKLLLILDRDSTIIVDQGYMWDPKMIEFLPGALESIKFASENNFNVAIATNQSGIDRGFFSLEDFLNFTQALVRIVNMNGGRIDCVAACPHSPERKCDCRKPKPGLIEALLRQFECPKENAIFFGNAQSDVEAGNSAEVHSDIAVGGAIKDKLRLWMSLSDHN